MKPSEHPRIFTLALIRADIPCSYCGWHMSGSFFVPDEEFARHGGRESWIGRAEAGRIRVHPPVLRAHAGECVRIRISAASEPVYFSDENGSPVFPCPDENTSPEPRDNFTAQFPARSCPGALIFRTCPPENGGPGAFGILLYEETSSSFHHIRTGNSLRYGPHALIRRADGSAFREEVLFVHLFPAGTSNDAGASGYRPSFLKGISYRVEPVSERLNKHRDPAYAFSSRVHHDPATPIPESYPGEEIVIRVVDLTRMMEHPLQLIGMNAGTILLPPDERAEETVPEAGFTEESAPAAAARLETVRIPKLSAPGDYLYYIGNTDDAWNGLWGIIRVHARPRRRLLPLQPPESRTFPSFPAPEKEDVIRRYRIAAVCRSTPVRTGDICFVPEKLADRARRADYQPKPLILKARPGEWLEVTLKNLSVPPVRVSLNPEYLSYDPVSSSGINVGYNRMEQTVPRGGHITYLWHAGKDCQTCRLRSFGDIRLQGKSTPPGVVVIREAGSAGFLKCALENIKKICREKLFQKSL